MDIAFQILHDSTHRQQNEILIVGTIFMLIGLWEAMVEKNEGGLGLIGLAGFLWHLML